MDEQRLFRLAVDALHVTAHHVPGRGWEVRLVIRRGDETWEDAYSVSAELLGTSELVDVIDGELGSALGL